MTKYLRYKVIIELHMGYKSKNKGPFTPQNPKKYLGNPTRIVYRSLYELKYMVFLDTHPHVLEWSSEETAISYRAPDGAVRTYFPDFVVKMRNKDGIIETVMVEIKPYTQTQPPKRPKKMTKRFLEEMETYAVNQAKWAEAQKYCNRKGMKFRILTENELGIKQ